jgi:hypothetical protein
MMPAPGILDSFNSNSKLFSSLADVSLYITPVQMFAISGRIPDHPSCGATRIAGVIE